MARKGYKRVERLPLDRSKIIEEEPAEQPNGRGVYQNVIRIRVDDGVVDPHQWFYTCTKCRTPVMWSKSPLAVVWHSGREHPTAKTVLRRQVKAGTVPPSKRGRPPRTTTAQPARPVVPAVPPADPITERETRLDTLVFAATASFTTHLAELTASREHQRRRASEAIAALFAIKSIIDDTLTSLETPQ